MSDVANTTRVFFALWRSQVGDKKQPRRWLRNISIKEVADTQRMFFSEWREVIAKLRMLQDLSARDMVRTTQVVSGEWRFAVKESKRRKRWLQKLFMSEMQNTVRVFFQTWFDALREKDGCRDSSPAMSSPPPTRTSMNGDFGQWITGGAGSGCEGFS
mmetsp:Transcript_29691/g.71379  ORF Transcript_29691/g.71379 Transcript_29691/m.71379 type:complete len:158 (+) Transcript_29691:1085-1558(+)